MDVLIYGWRVYLEDNNVFGEWKVIEQLLYINMLEFCVCYFRDNVNYRFIIISFIEDKKFNISV